MLFAHDTEMSLNWTAALVNTARGGAEELPDVAALDAFVEPWRWTGSRTHDEAVSLVNEQLREASALPQLVRHDGWEYHIHAMSPDAPLADRMAVDMAMA